MFTTGYNKPPVPEDYNHTFFKKYFAIGNLYTEAAGKKDLRMKNARVYFTTQKRDFDFFVVVDYPNQPSSKENFLFPIRGQMNLEVEVSQESKTVNFSWNAESGLRIFIEFEVKGDDFDNAIKFRNVIIRLIYQAINRKGFSTLAAPDELEQFCPFKDSTASGKSSQQARDSLDQISKEPHVNFANLGEMLQYDHSQGNATPHIIDPNFILVLRQVGDLDFELQIFSQEGKPLYKKAVDQNLQYYTSNELYTMNWLDNQVHFAFRFKDEASVNALAYQMTISIMQTMKKKKFDDIMKEGAMSDWNSYYNPKQDYEEEVTAQPQYNDYIDYQRDQVDWTEKNTFVEPSSFKDLKQTNLAVGKTIDRTFVTQENQISVYQSFDDDNFGFVCNLPAVKSLSGSDVKPRKMMLTEQDSKVLLLNQEQKDGNVYYMDLEKGKVISELTGANVKEINDITLFEKNADLTTNSLFFGCNDKNIFQMDPRVKDPVVAERPYATNYMFGTMTGAKDGTFAVGSRDGAIRLYNKCAGNAKNVLPSLLGEAILHLDSSKDGMFLLATCRSHVMLIPTLQDGKSGFDTTFRKDNKPKPIILKVNPKALSKHGIKELNYTYAIFDNKNQKETVIVANAGANLILWDLSKVLGGKQDSTTIKSLGDTIVQNQFKYNTDKLVAALPHKLVCQTATVSKR